MPSLPSGGMATIASGRKWGKTSGNRKRCNSLQILFIFNLRADNSQKPVA
jgi:hypothetical protein